MEKKSVAIGVSSCEMSSDDFAKFQSSISPSHVDVGLRQTLQMLWTILPKDQRMPETVESEFRRLAERVLRDFREDSQRYGGG